MAERISNEVYPAHESARVSWGGLFAGLAVAFVIALTLLLLGLSIGFATVNPVSEQNPFGGLGIGSALWWVISTVISLFMGGWVASRLAGFQNKFNGILHGLVVWALYTFLTVYLLTTAVGAIIGGTLSVIGNVLSATGETLGAGVQQTVEAAGGKGALLDDIRQTLPNLTEQEMQEVQQIAVGLVQGEGISEADRQTLVDLLTKYTEMSEQEAEQTVKQWGQQYRETASEVQQEIDDLKVQATELSGDAADALAQAALWTFIMLILGGAAAGIGGAVGRVKNPTLRGHVTA